MRPEEISRMFNMQFPICVSTAYVFSKHFTVMNKKQMNVKKC